MLDCIALSVSKIFMAYIWIGWTYWLEWAFGWSVDSQSLDRAFESAQQALSLDKSLSKVYALLGKIYLWKKQYDQAIVALEKATAVTPNYADGIAGLGEVLQFAGRPGEALEMFKKAIRLNPIPPVWYYHGLGSAYYLTGRYDEAIVALKRVINRNPNFWPAHIYMAASYVELKQDEKARAEVAEILRIVPDISLESSKKKLPYKDPAAFQHLSRALHKAGLK